MIFRPTAIGGVWLVEPERHVDERGFFARTWCEAEFRARGLRAQLAQASISYSPRRGTLRGLHYQAAPHEEAKLVRCTRGAVFDVVVDLRPSSPTFTQHISARLDAGTRLALYVPEGCAHGFQTLTDDTEVFYQMSTPHVPGAGRGVRWDDPAFAIQWPAADRIIAPRDCTYPDFQREAASVR